MHALSIKRNSKIIKQGAQSIAQGQEVDKDIQQPLPWIIIKVNSKQIGSSEKCFRLTRFLLSELIM